MVMKYNINMCGYIILYNDDLRFTPATFRACFAKHILKKSCECKAYNEED